MRTRLALAALLLLASGCKTPLERSRALDPAKPIPTLLLSQVVLYEQHAVAELALAGQATATLETVGERLLVGVEAVAAQHGLQLGDDPARPPAFIPDEGFLEAARATHPRGTNVDVVQLSEKTRGEVVAGRGLLPGEAGLAVSLRLRLEDAGRGKHKIEARLEVLALDPQNRRLLHAVGSGTHTLGAQPKLPPPLEDLEAAVEVALRDLDRQSREPALVD